MRKSELAIALSKLAVFARPKAALEQYPLDSQSASDILWSASQLGDIENKTIADFGCGTGILGIGALLLGAKHCYFIDSSEAAIRRAKGNLAALRLEPHKATFLIGDIAKFSKAVHVVLQNPPFGTKQLHADRSFLVKALQVAAVVYSIHKTSTIAFIKKLIKKLGGKITHELRLQLQLKPSMPWHRRKVYRVEASCLRIERFKK